MMIYGNPYEQPEEIRHQPIVRHEFTRVVQTGTPVTLIKTVLPRPAFHDALKTVMQQHGGDMTVFVTHCEFTFPEGSMDYELWPRLDSERLDVVFPDGYTIRETRPRRGYSTLSFPLESFSEEIRALYANRQGSTNE